MTAKKIKGQTFMLSIATFLAGLYCGGLICYSVIKTDLKNADATIHAQEIVLSLQTQSIASMAAENTELRRFIELECCEIVRQPNWWYEDSTRPKTYDYSRKSDKVQDVWTH